MANDDFDQAAADDWYERKSDRMAELLGPEHDMVMHAIIPYAIRGRLDLYYYPHGIPGTASPRKSQGKLSIGNSPSRDICWLRS